MAINIKNEGVQISAKRDGAMFNTFARNNDYIIEDIGDELEVTSSTSSFSVSLGVGEAVICGRSCLCSEAESITLAQNSSGYLVVEIDLTQTGANICKFKSVQVLQSENINAEGTIRDLPLYQYTTNTTGVSTLTDIRKIRATAVGGGNAVTIQLGTSWTLDSNTNLYYQDVSFTGMTANDKVNIEPVYTNKTLAQIEAIEDIISAIKYYDTMSGKIRFYASEETTTSVDLLVVGV